LSDILSQAEGSVYVADAVLQASELAAGTSLLMLHLHAPQLAPLARPGQFVQARLDPLLPLRRALSILDADPVSGKIVLLVQRQGQTGERLGKVQPGETLNLLGPLGHGFRYHHRRPVPLLVGEGIHAISLLFLALVLQRRGIQPHLWLAATPPLMRQDATLEEMMRWLGQLGIAAGLIPAGMSSATPLSWDVGEQMGKHVAEFLDQAPQLQTSCELFVGGGRTLLQACGQLAADRCLPAQAAVFAPMACALGGCWGCAVPLQGSRNQLRMVRACVEGPVLPLRRLVGLSRAAKVS
jgi:dihydroorotate dehydrogenase electron transfer subunit